jgi:hypothetical protein
MELPAQLKMIASIKKPTLRNLKGAQTPLRGICSGRSGTRDQQ